MSPADYDAIRLDNYNNKNCSSHTAKTLTVCWCTRKLKVEYCVVSLVEKSSVMTAEIDVCQPNLRSLVCLLFLAMKKWSLIGRTFYAFRFIYLIRV